MKRVIFFLLILNSLWARPLIEAIHDPSYAWMGSLVEQDLKAFKNKKIKRSDLRKGFLEKKTHVRYYRIQNSQIDGEGNFKKTLQILCSEVGLPDMELLHFEFDGPVKQEQVPSSRVPIFSGSKHQSLDYVFLVHDPTFHQDNGGDYDWKHLYIVIQEINRQIPWDEKIEKLIWRGANTGPFEMYEVDNWKSLTRGRLVYLSLIHPDLIDAKFCYIHPWKTWHLEDLKKVLPQADSMSHFSQIKYKYQIVLDGDTCTYPGLQWRLLSNSVLFKPASPLMMWFEGALIPWKHYIPLKADLSDLEEKIYWAFFHDERAKEIADNATSFAKDFLSEEAIYVYCYKLLNAYAKLLD